MPVIVYESSEYFIVDKDHGLNTEPDAYGHPNLMSWLKDQRPQYYRQRDPHPLHRLDRPVSGLLIVAKRLSAHKALQQLFEKKRIFKKYRAIVEGRVNRSSGILVHFHKKDPLNFKAIVSDQAFDEGIRVKLSFRVIQANDHYSELDIRPFTGRYHQIRAQLAAVGHPILGDVLYGAKPVNEPNSIALRAYKLSFDCPFEKARKVFESLPLQFARRWINDIGG